MATLFSLRDETGENKPKTIEQLLTPEIQIVPVNNGYLVTWSVSNVYLLANSKVTLLYAIHSKENIEKQVDVTGLNYYLIPYLQHYPYGQKIQWVKLRVEKQTTAGQLVVETPWRELYTTEDPIFNYVTQIQQRFIESRNSVTLFLYKLRYGGELCTKCFNYTLMKPSDPFCPECLGTGFKGGYWPAQPIRALIIGSPQKVLIRKYYIDSPTAWTFRVMADKWLAVGDVLFLPMTGTWLTVSHLIEQRYGAIPFTSIVACSELDEDSVQARKLVVPSYDRKDIDLNLNISPKLPEV